MSEINTKLAEIEAERLDVHVAANYERFKQIDGALTRLETQQEKMHSDIKEDISELKRESCYMGKFNTVRYNVNRSTNISI